MVKLIQKQILQITITLRKSDIANVNLIIPCKDLLKIIKLNKIDEDTEIFSYSYNWIRFNSYFKS